MSQCSSDQSSQRCMGGASHETPPRPIYRESPQFQARPLPVDWLEKGCNWPPIANTVIEDFAKKYNFYNLRKSDPVYEERLADLKHSLRELLDHAQWDSCKHEPMLQSKIEHKIHRLRKAHSVETGKSKLDLFEEASQNLDVVDHEAAVKILLRIVGDSRARAWMGCGPRFVNLSEMESGVETMPPMYF